MANILATIIPHFEPHLDLDYGVDLILLFLSCNSSISHQSLQYISLDEILSDEIGGEHT